MKDKNQRNKSMDAATNAQRERAIAQGRHLSGMKEICQYVARSEATVLSWIRDMQFPARKLGGIWESNTALIDAWRVDYLVEF